MRNYYRFSSLVGGAILIGILALSICQAAMQEISAIADSTTSRADLRGKVNAELLKVQANFAELYNASPGSVSDSAYDATTWDGVTNSAPSKNAVRDAIQALPGITNGTGIIFTTETVEGVTTTTISRANLYPATASATTATGNINIDGVGADHYYFSNGSTAASYTPVITSAPASGKERAIILTIGGGSGACTLVATNITWMSGTAPTLITTTNKKLSFGCLIPSSGNAQCNAIGGAHD